MAYKFQLGAAILSGSLTQEGQVLAKDSALSGSSLSLAGTAVTSTAAELNKLAGASDDVTAAKLDTLSALTDGEIGFVDGASEGTATASKAVVLDSSKDYSGMRNLSIDGALSASAGVSGSIVQGGVVVGPNFEDGLGGGFTVNSVLNATGGISIEGVTLTAGAADLNVLTNVVDATFDGANDKLIFSDSSDSNNYKTFTRASLATSLASGTGIIESAGQLAVDGTLADLDALGNVAENEFIIGTGAGTFGYTSGGSARTALGLGSSDSPTFAGLTVNGDLTVTGSLTYINTTNLVIEDALITVASGAADLGALTAAGAGIEFGSGGVESFAISGDIDGQGLDGFASSLPISASAFIGDGSALSGITADAASSLVEGVTTVASGSSVTLDFSTNKIQILNTAGGDANYNLPAASTAEGEVIKLKKSGDSNVAALTPDGTEEIDGSVDGIILESPHAAVMLASDGSDWYVF